MTEDTAIAITFVVVGVLLGILDTWLSRAFARWKYGRRIRNLPCVPGGVVDAFSMVARGELTPEQATDWLMWRENGGGR